jgi:phosphatidylethanolamine/phosphatidyl-N-methylethanolamine N-methyltransferase
MNGGLDILRRIGFIVTGFQSIPAGSAMLETSKVEKVYSKYSRYYDLVFGKLFHDSRLSALDLLGIVPGSRVLEVGVGTGMVLPSYPKDCRVVGIDLTGPMLNKGLERTRRYGLSHIDLFQMDATHMAFADDSFDSVMAAYVMTAVPHPFEVLAEMCRVCRPGGTIVMLNHFSNHNPFISRVERKISPFCSSRMGFRTDLTVEALLAGSPLVIKQRLKVNPLRFWQIVQCENKKG